MSCQPFLCHEFHQIGIVGQNALLTVQKYGRNLKTITKAILLMQSVHCAQVAL